MYVDLKAPWIHRTDRGEEAEEGGCQNWHVKLPWIGNENHGLWVGEKTLLTFLTDDLIARYPNGGIGKDYEYVPTPYERQHELEKVGVSVES